jgi:hypothetical protein
MKLKNLALATGFSDKILNQLSFVSIISGKNDSFWPAIYMQIGWLLSEGANVIYHDGVP